MDCHVVFASLGPNSAAAAAAAAQALYTKDPTLTGR